jgi:hypothetical protein
MATALAYESGNIQGMTERFIAESANYLTKKIPDGTYANHAGLDPYHIRWGVPPIPEFEYFDPRSRPTLEAGEMPARGCDGTERIIDTQVNNKGSIGCAMPANDVGAGGYDTFTRDLKANKWRIGPFCAWDFVDLGEAQINAMRKAVREDIPAMLVKNFEYELRRRIFASSLHNYSVLAGMPYASGGFTAAPTGDPELSFFRRIFQTKLIPNGWTGPREVSISREALERMMINYKLRTDLSMEINTQLGSKETQFLEDGTEVVSWGGIQWHLEDNPIRGYLRTVTGGVVFVPIYPTITRVGTGAGLVPEPNPDYYEAYTWCDGAQERVYEVAVMLHSTAFERQAFGLPSIMDQSWDRNMFNFEVRPLTGAWIECNEDLVKWAYLISHAYGWQPKQPERAALVIFPAQPEQFSLTTATYTAPLTAPAAGTATVTISPANLHATDECAQKEDDECDKFAYDVILPAPSAATPFPTNTAGTMRTRGSDVRIVQPLSTLNIVVERAVGSSGVSTIDYTTTAGTATAGSDYTTTAGTLSWADGEAGAKVVPIPILTAATAGQSFTFVLSNPVGGTLGTPSTVTVTVAS